MASSAVLAMDVVKHRNGIALADVLDRTLTLTGAELADLDDALVDDDARRAARSTAEQVCVGQQRIAGAMAELRRTGAGGAGLLPAEDVLSRVPIGTLSDLLDMVENDALGWTRERAQGLAVQRWSGGVTAVLDAVVAAYARPSLDPDSAHCLTVPWEVALGELPVALPAADGFGPGTATVRQLVDVVATSGPDFVRAVGEQFWADGTRSVDWAVAMHAAARATHRVGRTRPVARAQLAVARAVLLCGLPSTAVHSGVLMALTGAVASYLIADVVDDAHMLLLRTPWELASRW